MGAGGSVVQPRQGDDRRVVVIGSGPCGAIAAYMLVRCGIPVTLLESGMHVPSAVRVRAMGKTLYRRWPRASTRSTAYVASHDAETLWFEALAPGGLSNYWTGAVPRFAPEDFTEGERLHERYRWPVGYDDLAPFYERVEQLLVVEGGSQCVPNLPASAVAHACHLPRDWAPVAAAAAKFGHGLTPTPLANGPRWLLTRSGAPFNSYWRIISRLARSPLFTCVLGAHALQLEWDGAAKRVRSVVYSDRASGEQRRADCAAVVVAGGPLRSTKLLLDSTSADFPEGLGNTDGVLGRYLHDHAQQVYFAYLDRPLARLAHTAHLTRAPYAESAPLQAASCTIGSITLRDKVLAALPTSSTRFGVVSFGTMVPVESNFVRPHREVKDDFGMPQLDVHIAFDERAQRTMNTARDRLIAIFAATGVQAQLEERIPVLVPGASVHYGGTVRMHNSPSYGMLNGWNRLHAVSNVVVADASAFTTGVEKNPTLTAMALAMRAADHLADELKAS